MEDDDLIAAAERRVMQIAAMIEGLETLKEELLIEAKQLLAELDAIADCGSIHSEQPGGYAQM